MTSGAPFILYGRVWRHLCEDMRVALKLIAERFGVAIEWIDIDENPALEARYNELVPVLTLDGVEPARRARGRSGAGGASRVKRRITEFRRAPCFG